MPESPACARQPVRPTMWSRSDRAGGGLMISAYILIQTEVGKTSQVTASLGELKGIVSVDGVTGPYDVIARAESDDLDGLARAVVLPIQQVEGVTRTLTCPVL